MKKYLLLSLIVFSCLMFSACKQKNLKNEVINSYVEVDSFIDEANENEFKGYYFIDTRAKSAYVLGHRKVFINIYTLTGLKNYISSEKVKKNNLILLMGENENDENLNDFYDYLIEEGFKNVKKYVGGYDDYKTKEGFVPTTGDGEGSCDC